MPELNNNQVECYLRHLLGKPVTVLGLSRLGEAPEDRSLKEYGYGTPVRIDYLVARERRRAVIHTLNPGPFGHEHMSDRAQVLLWEHRAFNQLPQHVQSLDVGGFEGAGELLSLGGVDELFLLTEYVEGSGYFLDLARIEDRGELTELDLARADALCNYLVTIHKTKGPDAGLYIRRIRELVGHGECIMGLTDSYPVDVPFPSAKTLEEIEHLCLNWRWRLKRLTHRLRQVHGDFHPWNILFQTGTDFRVLDRSRGEFGDPADDVSSLTMNYLFSSLQRSGRLEGAFETLFNLFWKAYVERSGDREILDVVAPFFVFRGLVMASPVWYPTLSISVRKALFGFMQSVLQSEKFDPARVNEYCGL